MTNPASRPTTEPLAEVHPTAAESGVRRLPPAAREAIASAIRDGPPKHAARLLHDASRGRSIRSRSWDWVGADAPADQVLPVVLQLLRRGDQVLAAAILRGTDYHRAPDELKRRVGREFSRHGRHELAIAVFEDLTGPGRSDAASDSDSDERRLQDLTRLAMTRLHRDANKHVAPVPAPQDDRVNGFVVVYNVASAVLTGLMVPLIRPLMEQGYAVAAVTMGTLKTPRCGVAEFDRLQGCVAQDGKSLASGPRQTLAHQWEIDWAAGIAAVDGVNYYPYFQERLSQKARRYRADILSDPESASRFKALQLRADVALTLCERLLDLARRGRPIRIAIMDSHFAPQGIIREWCHQVGSLHGIHAVALSVGYENYFSNLTSLEATTLAVEDLTAQPGLRQPFLGGLHRMEEFLADNPHLDRDPDDQLLSWICQDRSNVGTSSRSRESLVRLAGQTGARGGKVFVALGKVSVDFAAPGDRGFAHDDFVAWMNHLIDSVAGTDNLLLVKPHPHELRKEIVVDGVQLLRDLVPPDLPANVVFLEHDSFNTHELAEITDAAFLWNGTAAVEFSVLGVPVVPASIWADRDYPVGLEILNSREEYEAVLRGERVLTLRDGVARRSAIFLRLMRSDHVAMPYRYLRRPATNLTVGAPTLDRDRLAGLEEAPDPFVGRAALRFFEFS